MIKTYTTTAENADAQPIGELRFEVRFVLETYGMFSDKHSVCIDEIKILNAEDFDLSTKELEVYAETILNTEEDLKIPTVQELIREEESNYGPEFSEI